MQSKTTAGRGRGRAPRTPSPADQADLTRIHLTAAVASLLREDLQAGRKLQPTITQVQRDLPPLIVSYALPGIHDLVELAIREALAILETEAADRRATATRRRRKAVAGG